MKIIFVCGSLEPGRDGVGDYTMKLAGQLIKMGHQAAAIALNDTFIKANIDEVQKCEGINLPVLRLTSSLSSRLRFNVLKEWIDIFQPDWISLQYVPYAFDNRGIPLYLGSYLAKLNSSGKWQVMIHESFIAKQKALKPRLIRFLQMLSVRSIKKNLAPAIFHTSIPRYQKFLQEISVSSQLLGLFGNIPIQQRNLSNGKGDVNTFKDKFTGIYFGSAPAPEYHAVFAEKIKAFCEVYQRCVHLVICGKSGQYGKQFAAQIEAACKGDLFEISFLGELEPSVLSNLFLDADFGIARTSALYLGKSGSSIAMLEHGLPLWVPVVVDDTIINNLDFRPDLCFHDLGDIINAGEKTSCINRLPQIAEKFLQDLRFHSS